MKICVWGAGIRGGRILKHLEPEDILYFVDSNENKIGKSYLGKEIISVEHYVEEYSKYFLLVTHMENVKEIEKRDHLKIQNYFYLIDCPGEFQEPYPRSLLKKYVESYLNSRLDYVLYGLTFYSILIDKWVCDLYGIHPQIIVQDDFDPVMLENVKEEFPMLNLIKLDEVRDTDTREICNVIYNGIDALNGFEISDLYDCSNHIKAYRNEKITAFKNKYEGQRCYIVATGPSLRAEDLDLIEQNNGISFSVNTIYKIFDQTNWRPTYYVVEDYRAIENYEEASVNVSKEAVFIADTKELSEKRNYGKDIHLYHLQYEIYADRLPKFSEDFAQKSYAGYTVIYTCIQLAVYMGFQEIYLLGADCNYVMGSKNNYFWNSDEKDAFNHEVDKMILGYQAAKKYADAHGIKIWNATRGGKLEVFDRVSIEEVFC